MFMAANIKVAALPQSKINSLTISPRVPMISNTKAINLVPSLKGAPPKFPSVYYDSQSADDNISIKEETNQTR